MTTRYYATCDSCGPPIISMCTGLQIARPGEGWQYSNLGFAVLDRIVSWVRHMHGAALFRKAACSSCCCMPCACIHFSTKHVQVGGGEQPGQGDGGAGDYDQGAHDDAAFEAVLSREVLRKLALNHTCVGMPEGSLAPHAVCLATTFRI